MYLAWIKKNALVFPPNICFCPEVAFISRWHCTIELTVMFGEFSHLEGTRHSAVVSHIYSTPENGTLAFACFSLSFCSGQKTAQKSFYFGLQEAGRIYYFLVVSWCNEVSVMEMLADAVVLNLGLKTLFKHFSRDGNRTIRRDSGLSTWTDCSRIRVRDFFMNRKRFEDDC